MEIGTCYAIQPAPEEDFWLTLICFSFFLFFSFFIRTVLEPHYYMNLESDGSLQAHTHKRSAFIIDIVADPEKKDGKIMIGSDKVTIRTAGEAGAINVSGDLLLQWKNSNTLFVGQNVSSGTNSKYLVWGTGGTAELPFYEFEGGFSLAYFSGSTAQITKSLDLSGERWEIVN